MKKYKLLKDYPPYKKGDILKSTLGGHYVCKDYVVDVRVLIPKSIVERETEYFAEYVFTTEDDVDIFLKEPYYYILNTTTIIPSHALFVHSNNLDTIRFSTKKAAQKYLDSLKPEFEVGVWYKLLPESGMLEKDEYCYGCYQGDNKGFGFIQDKSWCSKISMSIPEYWKKADLKEVEKLLLDKAEKDYPRGTKFNNAYESKFHKKNSGIVNHLYFMGGNPRVSGVYTKCDQWIFFNGKWAEIVEEKKYYGVRLNDYSTFTVDSKEVTSTKPFRIFDTEVERDDYIRLNKPQFSQKDMIEYGKYLITQEVGQGIDPVEYYAKYHLENWLIDNNDERIEKC